MFLSNKKIKKINLKITNRTNTISLINLQKLRH